MRMLPDQKHFLLAFNKHGVEYLVIGGHAVSEYAEPRATKDLDVFIRTNVENGVRVYRALQEFGSPLENVTAADFQRESKTIFQFGNLPYRVDIFASIPEIDFEEAWQRRRAGVIDDEVPTQFISREDLIRNKLAVGRHRDLADVEAMREANGEDAASRRG
jgi:hypothetical protein